MFMPSCDFFFNSTHEVLATVFCVLFSLFQFLVTIRKQRALVDDVGSTNTCFVCLFVFFFKCITASSSSSWWSGGCCRAKTGGVVQNWANALHCEPPRDAGSSPLTFFFVHVCECVWVWCPETTTWTYMGQTTWFWTRRRLLGWQSARYRMLADLWAKCEMWDYLTELSSPGTTRTWTWQDAGLMMGVWTGCC